MANGFDTFGSTKTQGFGSFGSFGGAPDANTVDGLVQMAQIHGGAVAQAAQSLAHPTTGILSSIGSGLKNAFKGFIDTISIPSEVVAGAISSDYSIQDAIALHIRPSDVLFGSKNPQSSTMQKVGSFLVRTAVDVLSDPVTYVTFGASSGSLFGARTLSKISLTDRVGTLTREGMVQLDYLKKVERQAQGVDTFLASGGDAAILPERLKLSQEIKAMETSGKVAPEVMGMGKSELKQLLKDSIDSPLNPDFTKKALSMVFESNPALVSDFIDKGGIKFFGKSLLSGQRISSVAKLIPGMTWLDNATAQSRLAVGALFDPTIQGFKDTSGGVVFQRMPPEYTDLLAKIRDMAEYNKDNRIKDMQNIFKANNINTKTSAEFLMASVDNAVIPADANLARAYTQLMGYGEKELAYLRGAGISVSKLDNHVPHMLVDSGVKTIPFKMPPSMKVNAAFQRTMEGGIFGSSKQVLEKMTQELSTMTTGTAEYAAKQEAIKSATIANEKFLANHAEWEKAVLDGNKKFITDAIDNTKRAGFEIFDDSVFTAHVARSMDNVQSISMKQFTDTMASHFASTADKAPPGWVPLDISKFKSANDLLIKRGMADSQLVFHPAIAKKIEEFSGALYGDEGTHAVLSAYDRLQSAWKASVTSLFPAFHGRNAISNVLQNFNDIGLEALNPVTNGQAAQFTLDDYKLNGFMGVYKGLGQKAMSGTAAEEAKASINDILTRHVFTDVHGYKWTTGELRTVMRQNNIALTDRTIGQIDVARTRQEVMDALNGKGSLNPLSANFTPYQYGFAFGKAVEGQSRMVNFMTNLRKTGDVALAVERTKQFLFDYQNLTEFERTVMKRLLPFYTFTKKNLEMQLSTLTSAPGRTAAQLTALTNLGDALAGQTLTPDEQKALPDWMQGSIGTLLSKNGNKVEILQSFGTPIEQPFQALTPKAILSSVSPWIRLPVELGAGYDFFQGKPISEVTNAAALKNAPGVIKDFVGYTDVSFVNKKGENVNFSVALRPDRLHLVLNLPIASRVLSAIKQMENVDVSQQNKLMQQLVGVRPYAFDLELEAAKREEEMKLKLESLLSSAGVGYTLNRFIPQK